MGSRLVDIAAASISAGVAAAGAAGFSGSVA